MHYSLTSPQLKFLNSSTPNTGMVAGLGSGKSFIATFKTIMMKLKHPSLTVAYYLPNYGLIQDIAFDKFPTMLNEMGLQYVLNKSNKEIHIEDNGKIIFRSMDNPETIVGFEVFYTLIDECDILPMAKMATAYNKIKARNRQKADEANKIDIVGTPEGFKFFYDRYITRFDPEFDTLIKSKTTDNPFLPENYVEELRREYPSELIEAYLNGEFTNLTSGTVYSQYDRSLNDTMAIDDGISQLHIGIDFNVTAMSAVVCLVKGKEVYAIAEHIDLFDTPELVEVLSSTYKGRNIICYPDSAGNARKSVQANTSDINLLRQAGYKIRANSKNPPIMDRTNGLNALFNNAENIRRCFINTLLCPKLTNAIEQQSYDENTKLPDKKSGHDNKGIDALGYLTAQLFPIRAVSSRREVNLGSKPIQMEGFSV